MHSDFNSYSSARSLEAAFQAAVSRQQKQRKPQTWPQKFQAALVDFLTGQQTISVRRQIASGRTHWIVYDPQRNERQVFETEQAVRVWFEQRRERLPYSR